MSCNINTALSDGKSFSSLSAFDQQLVITELICEKNPTHTCSAVATLLVDGQSFQSLSARAQHIVIAELICEIANGAATSCDVEALLSTAKTFQGASEFDGLTASQQNLCNVP